LKIAKCGSITSTMPTLVWWLSITAFHFRRIQNLQSRRKFKNPRNIRDIFGKKHCNYLLTQAKEVRTLETKLTFVVLVYFPPSAFSFVVGAPPFSFHLAAACLLAFHQYFHKARISNNSQNPHNQIARKFSGSTNRGKKYRKSRPWVVIETEPEPIESQSKSTTWSAAPRAPRVRPPGAVCRATRGAWVVATNFPV